MTTLDDLRRKLFVAFDDAKADACRELEHRLNQIVTDLVRELFATAERLLKDAAGDGEAKPTPRP